jgi:hypothetical protein
MSLADLHLPERRYHQYNVKSQSREGNFVYQRLSPSLVSSHSRFYSAYQVSASHNHQDSCGMPWLLTKISDW